MFRKSSKRRDTKVTYREFEKAHTPSEEETEWEEACQEEEECEDEEE